MNLPVGRTHRLSRAHFDALAAGGGGPDAVTVLRSAQLSRRILSVHAVAAATREREPATFAASGFDESLTALAAAHQKAPDAVAEVLLHPQVGAWTMRCLRRLEGTRQPADRPLAADLGHLGAVVAAAALRAECDCETTVWVSDGTVMIPTFGLATVDTRAGWGRAQVAAAAKSLRITAGGNTATIRVDQSAQNPCWLPLHRLRSGVDTPVIDVFLDDIDPFRDIDETFVPVPRLGRQAVAHWQDLLDEAWGLLTRHHGAWAEAIAAGLRSLVPLQSRQAGWEEVSATSADAFGAVSLTRPREPLTLAAALVHEFQHTKLAGVLGMLPLLEPADAADAADADLHYAPWRPDPRPLGGLFQGAYAYLGLTHFWDDHRRRVNGPAARIAHFEYARWRDQVRYAVGVLQASGRLTEAGTAFVSGMRRSLSRWHDTPVPAEELALARDIAAWKWTIWRLRNVEADPVRTEAWAGSWTTGRPCLHSRQSTGLVRVGSRQAASEPFVGLAHLRLREPDRFGRLYDAPGRLPDEIAGASAADALLVGGNHSAAAAACAAAIRDAPDDVNLWAGLALALRHQRTPATRMLVARPEVVYALHREIRASGGTAPDPLSLAAWLVTP